jgi:L-alanine-DL-glutamate epimerase-like enolase superfamily enzyme
MSHGVRVVMGRIALPRPLATARGTWTERRGVRVEISEGGFVGQGEATPLPGYSPDDVDACARAISDVAPRLDVRATHLEARFDAALAGLPCARFALETALVDLEAQRRGTSVAEVLAGAKVTRAVAVSGLVDLASPDFEEHALAVVRRGITTVKTKIGTLPRDVELVRLAALRRVVGDAVHLRLDANGAFDLAGARALLGDVAPFAPELVEEPASGLALAEIGRGACPWAADESLQDTRIVERLLASPCAAFVVKPQLHGLHAARALAVRAQEAGKAVIVTHLFDGPVAVAAACELALSLPAPSRACGLDAHGAMSLFGDARVPQLAHVAYALPHLPGLGVVF